MILVSFQAYCLPYRDDEMTMKGAEYEMHTDVRKPFDYDGLDSGTRAFVVQKTMETHGLLKRTAEHIIQIGQNLLSIKSSLGHGHFESWLQAEFAMTERQARRFMLVAERFGDKTDIMSVFPVTVPYELASPSTPDSVIEQVVEGRVAPTFYAIRSAKKAEQQDRAEQEALQQQLVQEREAAAVQIRQLSLELEAVRQQLTQLSFPPAPQIKEIPVMPPEATTQLATLRKQVESLTAERETLVRRVMELEAQAQGMIAKRDEERYTREIRLAWSNATAALHTSLLKFLAQLPTPQQTQIFEAADWNHLTQLQAMLQRVQDECKRLRQDSQGMVVEAMSGTSSTNEKVWRGDRTTSV